MVLQAEGDGIDHGLGGGAAAFSTRIEHGWVGTPGEDRARMGPERTAQQSAGAFRIGEGSQVVVLDLSGKVEGDQLTTWDRNLAQRYFSRKVEKLKLIRVVFECPGNSFPARSRSAR
jgi:hypothetical protein